MADREPIPRLASRERSQRTNGTTSTKLTEANAASDGEWTRREFLKSAVAIGGTAALGACLERESATVPTGDGSSGYPERQHAWNDALSTDDHGNAVPPRHRVILLFDYRSDGQPTEPHRETVASALDGVERAYERSSAGLLLTVSYSRAYFDRFDRSLPASVDLPRPAPLAPFEDPELEAPDAVLHLASDHAQAVLGAEAALVGEQSSVNGVSQPDAALTDVFEVVDRRTGFVGEGLPAENADVEGVPSDAVPDAAPLYMGYESAFEKAQATEDRVTIQSGPFAGGTTQQLSQLRLLLDEWYEEHDKTERDAKMFCPYHAETDLIDGVGENLGTSNGAERCTPAQQTADERGVVGHTQKLSAAREDDRPIILRRDFDSTDGDHARLHFLSLQREIDDFVRTRTAMNGVDVAERTDVQEREENGILEYLETERRGNYLLPPRSLRALPPANPRRRTAPAAVDSRP